MAHWGIALACGPHINLTVMPLPAVEMAWNELRLAQQNAEHASPVERDLIEALSHRYANPPPQDRAPLDQAYADAMRKFGLSRRAFARNKFDRLWSVVEALMTAMPGRNLEISPA
jgi:hypothetical protein